MKLDRRLCLSNPPLVNAVRLVGGRRKVKPNRTQPLETFANPASQAIQHFSKFLFDGPTLKLSEYPYIKSYPL